MAGLATAFGSGAATNSIEEIRSADVILIIGSNTSGQHPLVYARVADAKKNRNAKLIVVDPRTTPVAKLADVHLPVRPGGNLALINAMMHVILAEGLENRAFITERTEAFEALKASLETTTPEWAAPLTGLDPEAIRAAARLYAAGPDSAILYCMGVTQQTTGTESCAALANLVMLCGMIGRSSTGLIPLRGQNNVQGSCDMGALPESLPGYVRAGTELAEQRFTPVWGPFANARGRKLTEVMHDIQEGRIKALYVMGENPMLSDPDTSSVAKALRNLDLLVVQDIFMTQTAELAHVVLPAASYLEKDGTFTNTERRVQRVRTVLQPLPGTRPDWQILSELIERLGGQGGYTSPEAIFNEMRTVVPAYTGMTYARIEKQQGLCWPCPTETHPGTPVLHSNAFSRGLGLFTVNHGETATEEPDDAYPFTLITGRLPHHYHTGTMTRRSWALERECPEAFLEMHPDDAARIGAKSHWKVSVRSRRGEVFAQVLVTDGITPGNVFLPFHFLESAANMLTSHEHLDPTVKIPSFKVSAVAVTVC